MCLACKSTSSQHLTPTAHPYSHPLTYVEAAVCLTSEDKPKELINAIKLLLQNAKFLDPNFGLPPLKYTTGKPVRIITIEDNIPSNFTHLGQYAFITRNRIFEKKKNWRRDKENKLHRGDAATEFNDTVEYFNIAIATDLQPQVIIDGIRMEWEMHGGGGGKHLLYPYPLTTTACTSWTTTACPTHQLLKLPTLRDSVKVHCSPPTHFIKSTLCTRSL
jgi:hypothetical protein